MSDTHEPERDELDARLREHYRAQVPGTEKLDVLRSVAQEGTVVARGDTPARRGGWLAAVALAAASLAVGLGLGASLVRWESGREATIAREIVSHHRKQLLTEVAAAEYPELARVLDRLAFDPVSPKRLAGETLSLEGARYCSIETRVAVLCRLRREGVTAAATLYQFRVPEGTLRTSTFSMDGVRVRVWSEGGLGMGLAEDE